MNYLRFNIRVCVQSSRICSMELKRKQNCPIWLRDGAQPLIDNRNVISTGAEKINFTQQHDGGDRELLKKRRFS